MSRCKPRIEIDVDITSQERNPRVLHHMGTKDYGQEHPLLAIGLDSFQWRHVLILSNRSTGQAQWYVIR